MFLQLNSSQVHMPAPPTIYHRCFFVIFVLNHLITKHICPKQVEMWIKMNKRNRKLVPDLLHLNVFSSQMTIMTPSKKDSKQSGVWWRAPSDVKPPCPPSGKWLSAVSWQFICANYLFWRKMERGAWIVALPAKLCRHCNNSNFLFPSTLRTNHLPK